MRWTTPLLLTGFVAVLVLTLQPLGKDAPPPAVQAASASVTPSSVPIATSPVTPTITQSASTAQAAQAATYEYEVLPGLQPGYTVGTHASLTPHNLDKSCGWHDSACKTGVLDGAALDLLMHGVQSETALQPVYAVFRAKTVDTNLTAEVLNVIPEVKGKLDGLAYRVPTPTVSIVGIVALTEKDTSKEEVNATVAEMASEQMKGILGITHDPVVSMDLKGDERSSIVDGRSTNVVGGNLVKVAAWYDNEWGYACRLSDLSAMLVERGL